jgi:hypothetical protein
MQLPAVCMQIVNHQGAANQAETSRQDNTHACRDVAATWQIVMFLGRFWLKKL